MDQPRKGPMFAVAVTCCLVAIMAWARTPDRLCEIPFSDPVSSSAVILTPGGREILAVNPDSCSITVVDRATLETVREIAVGRDPRTVAVTPDGRLAVTANREDGTVSVVDLGHGVERAAIPVGGLPWGVVTGPGRSEAWVACEGSGWVCRLDLDRRAVTARVATEPDPAGLALLPGGTLLVTHLRSGRVSFLDTGTASVESVVATYSSSNLSSSLATSPGGTVGYLPQTRSNSGNPDLTFDTTVFPIVAALDIPGRKLLRSGLLSLAELDRPVAVPVDAAVSPDGGTLAVVNGASNDLSVFSLTDRTLLAHVQLGAAPRGIAFSPDGSAAYVDNTLDGTLSVIETAGWTVTATVRLTRIPLPPALLHGKRLFSTSADTRLSRDRWIACISCHWEGEHDGRTWQFAFSGPRNTTSLRGSVGTYPLRWSARWDEAADAEFAVWHEQFGTGLIDGAMNDTLGAPNQGRSYDLDCLGAYTDSLAPPAVAPPAADAAAVAAGRQLFFSEETGCSSCHPPPRYTDFRTHDVGTASSDAERLGPEIDTPSLLGLARSAPYLHDGSAPDLLSVLSDRNPAGRHGVTSHLSATEREQLAAFLRSLPSGGTLPPPAFRPTGSRRSPSRPAAGEGGPGGVVRLSGTVVTADGVTPVAGAFVTTRNGPVHATTGRDGTFTLALPANRSGEELEVTAWAEGFFIAAAEATPPASGLVIALRPLHTEDHSERDWVDPRPASGDDGACGQCHPGIVDEWSANAHAGAVSNPRFFSFYEGTTVDGSAAVEPGYLTDFPGTAGNCAACHAPGAAVDAPFTTGMRPVRGDLKSGIHCQVCHDTERVFLDPVGARPYRNMPGVFSMRILRPPAGASVFFGPFPDIHDPDSYAPQMRDGRFCAPCHEFGFWGTPIYTSYGEWLESPYADRGVTCQSCHMPPTGVTRYALPSVGGLEHDPASIPSHLQLGVGNPALMASAASLGVEATRSGGELTVAVTVTNSGTGHHLPTDHPGRHLILLVRATAASGAELEAEAGPTVPEWGGSLAGRTGMAFAKLLRDAATGISPVVSYWKPTLIAQDTRIPAGAAVTGTWRYPDPGGTVHVTAELRFRRLFEPIAGRYGWSLGEMIMKEVTIDVPG